MEFNQREMELIVDACKNEQCLATLTTLATWRQFKTLTDYTNAEINYLITAGHNKKEYILQKLKDGKILDSTRKFASILCIKFVEIKMKQLRNRKLDKKLWNEIYDKADKYIPIIFKLDPKNKDELSLIDAIKNLENARTYRNYFQT